jgi:hypothetical protein
VNTQSATPAELLLVLGASTRPEYVAPWSDVLARWAPSAPA